MEQTLEAVTEPELTSYWQGLNGSKAQLMSMNEFIGNEHKDLFPLNVNDVLVIFLVLSLPQTSIFLVSIWQLPFHSSILPMPQ